MSTILTQHLYRTDASESTQRTALTTGEIPVAVYGLGKMGLPLASVYGDVTGNVIGVDIDPSVVETINDGNCHIKREPGLASIVSELVSDGSLEATVEPRKAAANSSVHVVIVPTPITNANEPDLSILDTVIEDIATGLQAGDFVIIECTVPPQTTEHRVRTALESNSGLSLGEFGLAFCPERTSSGRALEDIRGAYPKVVGGIDEESTRVGTLIYEEINDRGVIPVSDATTAEAVKMFEGLYRDVNIGLAIELATLTDEMGIDVNEAIEVANTQPFCDIHDPGPGVGGHCIPFYPYFVINPFSTETPLLEMARSVNDSMPTFTVRKIREEFVAEGESLEGSSVLLLGLTYRPGVEEIRASPSIAIADELSSLGMDVYGVDPMLDTAAGFDLQLIELEEVYDQSWDAIISVTPHDEFESIQWESINREGGQLVVIDGRGTVEIGDADHRVYTIGSGWKS